ncbi:MAG: ATP-binding protein [Bacteroidaceae bacterium]|nr:ATP-binding protein [Bacteroidaceae bacterium]
MMNNTNFIQNELDWLATLITHRLKCYFGQEQNPSDIKEIVPQPLSPGQGSYCDFLMQHGFQFEDRVCLILSFVPYLKPQLMDCFGIKNSDTSQRFVEFGCEDWEQGKMLLPTLETVMFVLAGNDVGERMRLAACFTQHPVFSNVSYFKTRHEEASRCFFRVMEPSDALLDVLLLERPFVPRFSSDFPARKITTQRTWDELVLDEPTMRSLDEIRVWMKYGEQVRKDWGLANKLKPGYRALFYGQSGCGKTFAASLLGKISGKDVYCIDLSMVVSKYIGETEKNLSKVFELAEDKDWILFFDEADALFGKRTNIKDSHDRYANQEVAYLLQRVEDYRGLVVLSTNLKANIDEAFARRFQSVVRFPMPNSVQRERLWRDTFPAHCQFETSVDLKQLSEKYEISGGSILNVVQYCSIMAMSRNETIIRQQDIMEGIKREFRKEGKVAE